jgi:hypothetical protein
MFRDKGVVKTRKTRTAKQAMSRIADTAQFAVAKIAAG